MNNKISYFRTINSLTQEDLANLIEVSRQTISLIERNCSITSLKIALKIAKVFRKNAEDIFIIEN